MKGKIIKNISNDYTVETQDGKKYICKPRGKFRINNLIPLVGDIVEFMEKNKRRLPQNPMVSGQR